MKMLGKIIMTLGVLLGSFVLVGSFVFDQENALNAPPMIFALVLGLGTIAAIFVIWRRKGNTPEEENSTDF
ncbi:MMPL family transporter [Salegentibacter sp. Hel_I_6]|uniref:MMPL family transporter n=1 Tax=Salegentibacter sp. Hel_I_6 TaxID=1250278 RepID=UPI0012E0C0C2|nr:MMPL family transporter [Salegentibacter sp. Hel_I_6]